MHTSLPLILLLLLTACSTPAAPPVPSSDPNACPSFVIPNTFGFEWDMLNHRVSLWDMNLLPNEPGTCLANSLTVGIIGGDFSTGERFTDQPNVQFGFQSVVQNNPKIMGASRFALEFELDASSGLTHHVALDRAEHNLLGYGQLTALIAGFSFRTDAEQDTDYPTDYDPAHGYTSRGLGLNVVVTDWTDSSVHLQVDARFEHGTSDRDAMNAAIPHAKTAIRVDLLLLGVRHDVPIREGGVEYSLNYPLPEPLSKDRFEPASEDQQRVVLEGEPGHGAGIYGWSQLDFRLAPSEEDDPEGTAGYYIRAFHAAIEQKDYDPQTGLSSFHLNGYASNTSEAWAYYGMNHHFVGKMVWLQMTNPPPSVVINEAVSTGTTTLELGE